ncbi:hypothetical protein L1049_005096 [Liquidambar formosana]|uniref:Uncharacterized protein n=1 Tax=Liquidambar formosana TaxID=63359 RepID=A0AAP0RUM5_LIQFO
MSDDEWVKEAMTDDVTVVELLMRLNQEELPPPHPPPHPAKRSAPALPLDWSVRQRRTKQAPRLVKKNGESTRASPTTPLSWSGATSVSGGGGGGADGFEESSRPAKRSDGARSKVTATSEATTTKRSRKKKTLLELKEEESLLLKERKRLRNELAIFRATVEKQRATNENLKRMKLDLQLQLATKTVNTSVGSEEAIHDQPQQMEATCDPVPSTLPTSVVCNDLSPVSHQSPPNISLQSRKGGCKSSVFICAT